MTTRFEGTCEEFLRLDVAGLINWVRHIPYEEWPQQHKLAGGKLRPAMACDPDWHKFKRKTDPVVNLIMNLFPGCVADTRMLSVVMPGHEIPVHVDLQSNNWCVRVHVPLTTNDHSKFVVGGVAHYLEPGKAYKVNTLIEHSVINNSQEGRVHFMFDVRNDA